MIRRPPRSPLFPYPPLFRSDDAKGITASILDGILLGSGDACIGINPASDDPAVIGRLLRLLDEIVARLQIPDRKSTRLNSSHSQISYAVFCLKKNKTKMRVTLLVVIIVIVVFVALFMLMVLVMMLMQFLALLFHLEYYVKFCRADIRPYTSR